MATIVIGGGLSGLTAANTLADRGETVTLLEARHRLGGRATTDERGGHLLNQGPHALYLAGNGLRILRELGIDPPGGVPPVEGALGVYEGRIVRLPSSRWSLLRTPLLAVREKIELAKMLLSLSRVATGPLAAMSTSEWLETTLSTERLRLLVGGMISVATYAADLDVLSADVGVSQLQLAFHNVRYVDGGWETIVNALTTRARAAGVDIRTGSAAASVAPAPGGGWEVELSAGRLTADQVIVAAASPAAAARLTGSTALLESSVRMRPITAATLDVGLRALPVPRRRFAYGIDRPMYFSVHNPPASLGTGITLHVMKYLGRGGESPAASVRSELEDFLELLQPGWRDVLDTARFLRRMVVSNAIPTAPDGAGGRPSVVVPDRPGILVAGDWVGPEGHLGDAAITSGRRAAEAVDAARLVQA